MRTPFANCSRTTTSDFTTLRTASKSEASASKKIQKDGSKYTTLLDLHDFLGIRITTYFVSQMDQVAALIEREFEIDSDRSSDKRSTTDPDRFGYVSLHYVIKLGPNRRDLGEWAPFKDMVAEIQIRTILQHAWAEIEHDLGYKAPDAIPDSIKRRFSRLAGLLELADDEFESLRDASERHALQVDEAIKDDTDVPLDQDSTMAFITTNSVIHQADSAIAEQVRDGFSGAETYYAADRAIQLGLIGLRTTSEVSLLVKLSEALVGFAVAWLSDAVTNEIGFRSPDMDLEGRFFQLSPGISLFYLYLHLVIERQGVDGLRELRLGGSENSIFVDRLLEIHSAWFGPTVS